MKRITERMANSENRTRAAILSVNLCFLLILTTPYLMFAQGDELVHDVEAIVKKMDQLYRSETSHAEMEMQIAHTALGANPRHDCLDKGDGQNVYPNHCTKEGKGRGNATHLEMKCGIICPRRTK